MPRGHSAANWNPFRSDRCTARAPGVGSLDEHKPVLVEEAVAALAVRDGGSYVDATYGRGGHSARILAQLGPAARDYHSKIYHLPPDYFDQSLAGQFHFQVRAFLPTIANWVEGWLDRYVNRPDGMEHGDPKDLPRIYELVTEAARRAKKRGFVLGLENVGGSYVSTGAESAQLLKAVKVDSLGLTWDPNNAGSRGEKSFPDGYRLLARHRRNRRKPSANDGRRLRRLRRRWRVERTNARLKTYRRAGVRYEVYPDLHERFVALAYAFITLNRLLK